MVSQVTCNIEIAQFITHVYELSMKIEGVTRYLLKGHNTQHSGHMGQHFSN